MIKKLTLITMCLILLTSCGRKNDPKYETLLNFKTLLFNDASYFGSFFLPHEINKIRHMVIKVIFLIIIISSCNLISFS